MKGTCSVQVVFVFLIVHFIYSFLMDFENVYEDVSSWSPDANTVERAVIIVTLHILYWPHIFVLRPGVDKELYITSSGDTRVPEIQGYMHACTSNTTRKQ